jgi:hypothetical protein
MMRTSTGSSVTLPTLRTRFSWMAQQLDLHGERQVGHLVEKERAAAGGLEEAVPVVLGAGEGALAVAEELAFHQVFRDRAAVDRHEGAGGAGAAAVDQAGAQFLAAAGFAGDVDRRLAARQLFDHGAHLLHARRFADQASSGSSLSWPPGQAQGRLDQGAQLLQADRLGQVVEGAGLQRGHGIAGAAEGGDHRHRRLRAVLGDVADDLQAFAIGQAHVGQAELEIALLERRDGFADRAGTFRRQAHAGQRQVDQFADVGLVVDDEYPAQFAARAPFGSGN